MYFQLLAVRFLLVCLLISFASLSSLFLSERRREVSDGRIKSSIKDEKPFGFICIHACLWLLLSTTSAHTWSWVLLCVCLFAQVCVWNYMNIKSVITERRKARSDPVMMMMISMGVCVWVGEAALHPKATHNPSVLTFLLHSDIQEQRWMYTLLGSLVLKKRSQQREKEAQIRSIWQGRDNILL